MDWQTIITSIVAGGLGGQLLTLLLTEKSASRREYRNWLREERMIVYFELIDLVSSTAPRDDYNLWPTQIRSLCQKVHLLFPDGVAPEEISILMENVFQLARDKKHNKIENHDEWTNKMRDETRKLRKCLSNVLQNT